MRNDSFSLTRYTRLTAYELSQLTEMVRSGRLSVRMEALEARRVLSVDITPAATASLTADFATRIISTAAPVDGSTNVSVATLIDGASGDATLWMSSPDGKGTPVQLVKNADGSFTFSPAPSFRPTPTSAPAPAPTPATQAASDIAFTLGTVVQADGKVITASLLAPKAASEADYTFGESHSEPGFDRISLTRYNADGSVDASFGTNGSTTYAFGQIVNSGYGSATGAVADAQGRILVPYSSGIIRFNADGTLDTSFGNGGAVKHEYPWAIKPMADGKILVITEHALSRLNADGLADTSFTDYQLHIASSLWGGVATFRDAAIAPDGSIYVVGEIRTSNMGVDQAMTSAFISKLHADGTPDTSFGKGGRFELGEARRKWESFNNVAVLPDGKIQVVGKGSIMTDEDPDGDGIKMDKATTLLARFNADGSLDSSFNHGQVTLFTQSVDDLFGMFVLPDGRIVASTYGADGAQLLVANGDGSDLHFVQQRVDTYSAPHPHGYIMTYTQAPSLAPDGTIVTGVGVGDLNYPENRETAHTYWTRIDLDAPRATRPGDDAGDDAGDDETATPPANTDGPETTDEPIEGTVEEPSDGSPAAVGGPVFATSSFAIGDRADRAFDGVFGKDKDDPLVGGTDELI